MTELEFQIVNPSNADVLLQLEQQRSPGANRRMIYMRVRMDTQRKPRPQR